MRTRRRHGGRARSIGIALLFVPVSAALQAQTHVGQYEQADIEHGARLYAGHCVACHGERGDMLPVVNLRSGQFRKAPTDRELSTLIRTGIPGTAMTATGYSDSELTALVAYLRNMGDFDASTMVRGDAERGRTLFDGKGDCGSCHRVNGRGPRAAPDLSTIGVLRTAGTLERTLLEPDAGMVPINRPVRAVTRSGAVVTGRRVNEDTFTVQLVDANERLVSLEKAALREFAVGTEATMPSYATVFTPEERADLIAYLLSLKGLE